MKANLNLKKKVTSAQKNFAEEKNIRKDYQVADNLKVLSVSEKIIKRNKKIYAELAK